MKGVRRSVYSLEVPSNRSSVVLDPRTRLYGSFSGRQVITKRCNLGQRTYKFQYKMEYNLIICPRPTQNRLELIVLYH